MGIRYAVTNGIVVLVLIAAGSAPALAQLPDGPGRDTVIKVCGACHNANTTASVRLTRDGWQNTIADMVSRGARGTDEELATVLDYLSTHFLGEADRPLNINTASSVELESVLSFLRRESAALIAYREKHKPFTSIDDLKNIPGVPFQKIEEKKDRIVFGLQPADAPK